MASNWRGASQADESRSDVAPSHGPNLDFHTPTARGFLVKSRAVGRSGLAAIRIVRRPERAVSTTPRLNASGEPTMIDGSFGACSSVG